MAESKKRRTTTSSGSKKSGTTTKKTKSAQKNMEQENGFIRREVVMICSFAMAVLLFCSNFKLCGMVGGFLRSIMLGTFGTMGYLMPVLLFVGTCFYMSNQYNRRAFMKIGACIICTLSLCGSLQLLFGVGYHAGESLGVYYQASSVDGAGGGLVGGMIVSLLCSTLGVVGTYLVLVVLLVISLVCITEKSVVSVVKKGSGKAYQYAKEDMDRRREIHEVRQEERRKLREDQRVRGVNLNSTKLEEIAELEKIFSEPESIILPALDEAPFEEDSPEAAAAKAEEAIRKADVFVGRINLPKETTPDVAEPVPDYQMPEPLSSTYFGPEDLVREGMDRLKGPEEIFPNKEIKTLGELDVVPDDDFYKTDSMEQGLNYDSIFVPEGKKTVVTASGKIIETETELLQKKLENKEERNIDGDGGMILPGTQSIEPRAIAPQKKNIAAEKAEAELTLKEQIRQAEKVVKKKYKFPPISLLTKGAYKSEAYSEKEYKETAIKLQQTLQNFGVGVTVTDISCGPAVTRYELHPEQGVKVSKIVGLTDDIKLNLAAADIRIEAPIPGKSAVGIEVPNKENSMVRLRDLFEATEFTKHSSKLAFAVGKDIGGKTVVTDIAKMPHLLIAGATGSGKSVCINTLIMSIIYKSSPDDVKLIMVDPKVVELSVYNGIPHLLIPVVTDPKKASAALNWAVAEMTDRYKKFAEYNVRDLKGYNEKIKTIDDIDDENKPQKLPQIVIIVDELADLMMVAPGEVEDAICRLAQLARAAGIHLVIATQRPSVNVITGLIKANVPSRIAFSVSSGVDSRTIIDMNGAEKLLGKGDMLFYPAGFPKPQRVQGAFISDQEVTKVVEFLTEQGMTADYNPEIEAQVANGGAGGSSQESGGDRDSYFVQAGRFIIEKDKASIGMLQRMFKIGFNRAARIMDQLAEAGVVGEEEGTKPRKILMSMEEFDAMAGE